MPSAATFRIVILVGHGLAADERSRRCSRARPPVRAPDSEHRRGLCTGRCCPWHEAERTHNGYHPAVAAEGRLVRRLQCDIPCPCEFAQAPTGNECNGVMVWHIREGQYGDIPLAGLNLLALCFKGTPGPAKRRRHWASTSMSEPTSGSAKALQLIFGGEAGAGPRCSPDWSARCGALSSRRCVRDRL